MKIYTLGTSITAGSGGYDNYPDLLSRELGVEVVNLGTSGGTLGKTIHGGTQLAILNAADKISSDADIVIMECIMNDFRFCTPVGKMFDKTADTFYGALYLLIEKLKTNAPKAKIFFTNSHENADTKYNSSHVEGTIYNPNCLGHWVIDYMTAVEEIASYRNQAKVIDTFHLSGIRVEGESNYYPINTYDKLHLTNEGSRIYASVISDALRRELIMPKKLLRKIIYIPIDNRPCNYERIKLGGESMGLEIILPPKSLVATKLDGQMFEGDTLNAGNREELLNWLNCYHIDHNNEIDAYLLSMDMLYSGGLVCSRDNNYSESSDTNVLNKILNFLNSTSKPVYIIDTVMRLAATAGFNGYEMSEYEATRNYGAVQRKVASAYSVQSVIDCMRYNINGEKIAHPGLTTTQVDRYIAARTRKIKFTSKLIQAIKNKTNVYVLYGVDDSSSNNNIQTNEIKYIQDTLPVDRGTIMAGTDELAMTMLARISIDQFAKWTNTGTAPKVKITYFGGGENSGAADMYDYNTLKHNVDKHLQASNCNVVTSGEILEVLILTKGYSNTHVTELINKLRFNINNKKLTAVIDGSANTGTLQKELLSLINKGEKLLSNLLAYSSWNTVGNAVGLCLGHAIGRACFMTLGNKGISTTRAAQGQVDLLFLEYSKDMCYKLGANAYAKRKIAESCGVSTSGQEINNIVGNLVKYSSVYNKSLLTEYEKHIRYYLSLTDVSSANYNINRLIDAFTNATMYTYYNTATDYGTIGINKPTTVTEFNTNKRVVFPWGRHFEALLDTEITLKI